MKTFGQLAKRLSTWTSRGLVSAIILVAGLAFGRQVLLWWGADEGPSAATSSRPLALGVLGDPGQDHVLEFGDSDWRIVRGAVSGDAVSVSRELQARCAKLIGACRVPTGEPGPAERGFLDRVARQKPALEEAGQWRLYALDAAFPMVIGTREVVPSNGPPNDRVVKPTHRVVTWGLAAPTGSDMWVTYAFHALPPEGDRRATALELPIPPGSRKTLAIRAADGSAVTSFKGPDREDEWKRFFDAWLETHGWEKNQPWQDRGATQSLRCIRRTDGVPESLDVLLAADGTGEMTGLVLVAPAPRAYIGKQQ